MTTYQGFNDIGAALAGGLGGLADKQGSWMKGAQQGATLDRALSDAKIKRDQALQRDNFDEKLAAAYQNMPPEQMALLSALSRGSENLSTGFSTGAQGLGRMQGVLGQQQAMELPQPGQPGYTDLTPDILNHILAASGANPGLSAANVDVLPQARAKTSEITERTGGAKRLTEARIDTEHARKETEGARKANVGKGKTPPKPKPGDVLEGHRFKGGDPSKKENWEKQ